MTLLDRLRRWLQCQLLRCEPSHWTVTTDPPLPLPAPDGRVWAQSGRCDNCGRVVVHSWRGT